MTLQEKANETKETFVRACKRMNNSIKEQWHKLTDKKEPGADETNTAKESKTTKVVDNNGNTTTTTAEKSEVRVEPK
jgi:hypothetical protein